MVVGCDVAGKNLAVGRKYLVSGHSAYAKLSDKWAFPRHLVAHIIAGKRVAHHCIAKAANVIVKADIHEA